MRTVEIDRFEGDLAVCELDNGTMINIPKSKFAYEITEGDIINVEIITKNGDIYDTIIYGKNEEEKRRRLEEMKKRKSRINRC